MNPQYFFINEDVIEAEGLDIGFSLYSAGHLLWLAAILIAGIWLSQWYRRQPDDKRRTIRRIFAVVLAVMELVKNAVLVATGFFSAEYLPFHLCGLAIFALLADAFWEKQKISSQMVAYAFMPGTVAALLFCNWTHYPFFNFMNIHSFVFHGWIFFYFLMRYRAGEIRPVYSGMWKAAAILVVLVYPLYRFNAAFDTNFMFLNEASAGSPLVPLWNIFGTRFGHPGYILSVIGLVILVFHALYTVYRLIENKKTVNI